MTEPAEVARAASEALDEVERQLKNEVAADELLDPAVDLSWTLPGPAGWQFHVEAERLGRTSEDLQFALRLYGRRWLRTLAGAPLVEVKVGTSRG